MIKVSDNKRFLTYDDGRPFFYLGDTAWELFHRLTREEMAAYMENRSAKRFTVIQAVILAEMDGLEEPNAYGDVPLRRNASAAFDPMLPAVDPDGYDYWQHVDYAVDLAASLGLVMGLVPTWGDKVTLGNPYAKGPELFAADNARAFGRYVGARYKACPNIVWILGGDRNPDTKLAVWRAMAEGLREGDGGSHLITYHPLGGYSSSIWFHHDEWLDYHTNQSGHGARHLDNYNMIAKDYHLHPPKPTFDGEPRYEGHSVNWNETAGYFTDDDIRQAAYWAVLAGAFGHTYGHTSVWQLFEPGRPAYSGAKLHWREALDSPGAEQMRHFRALFESRPFLRLVPDQQLLVDPLVGSDHIRAARGDDYIYAYSSTGQSFELRMGRIPGSLVQGHWYDPRTGQSTALAERTANRGIARFTPPTSGIGQDWVLILDADEEGDCVV
ncbi:DUF4038 domain-containing protein [Paenibacillus sacheonensis]|uniref:DUF4038 domain-containing protein n=2 Tax=Paenibacillus sacheonensis TaxID=742054 RepID=A0A7X4YQ72_9BACL|nr:glycoside hydrolase family 140 protein [Paenibacillus sacheonensis]NBC69554.1 DUF4038 domain-containing protein [Paenibacillus sacheonensis]